jgi:hypothetical protein
MKIKMVFDRRGCPDGHTHRKYLAGFEYETPPAGHKKPGRIGFICREDAHRFVRDGYAVIVEASEVPDEAMTIDLASYDEKGAQ